MHVVNSIVRFKKHLFSYMLMVSVLALLVICITVIVQIVMRRVVRNTIEWAEDLAVFLFVWITFLGAAVLFDKRTMISVDAVTALLPVKVQRLVGLVTDATVLIAVGYLIILSYEFLLRQRALGHNLGGALRVPSWVIMIPVIIALTSMAFSSLVSLLEMITDRSTKSKHVETT